MQHGLGNVILLPQSVNSGMLRVIKLEIKNQNTGVCSLKFNVNST
jgi:hypothetical protein